MLNKSCGFISRDAVVPFLVMRVGALGVFPDQAIQTAQARRDRNELKAYGDHSLRFPLVILRGRFLAPKNPHTA